MMFIQDKYNTKIHGSDTINAIFRYNYLNIFVLSGGIAEFLILLLFENISSTIIKSFLFPNHIKLSVH
jgi:hypothetical protein